MARAFYKGARPHAWRYLVLLLISGASLGALGYWEKLRETAHSWPTLQATAACYALGFSALMTAFLNIAYAWAANRHSRPLSPLALVLYTICCTIGEGFLLLAVFDLGRWLRPLAVGAPQGPFTVGTNALESKGFEHPDFWRDFIWGFAPFTLLHAVMYSYMMEPLVLPDHLVLDAPNTFMRAIVVAQFSYIVLYYFTGDVFAYCLMRGLNNLLAAAAVRMPPPGAQVPPVPDKKKKA